MKENPSEKRKLKRRHLIYYLKVHEQGTDQFIGHLVDITTEGMMLISKDPIEAGVSYRLYMELPEAIGESGRIRFDATCLWKGKSVNPDFFEMGFRLTGINSLEVQRIRDLIKKYSFNDMELPREYV